MTFQANNPRTICDSVGGSFSIDSGGGSSCAFDNHLIDCSPTGECTLYKPAPGLGPVLNIVHGLIDRLGGDSTPSTLDPKTTAFPIATHHPVTVTEGALFHPDDLQSYCNKKGGTVGADPGGDHCIFGNHIVVCSEPPSAADKNCAPFKGKGMLPFITAINRLTQKLDALRGGSRKPSGGGSTATTSTTKPGTTTSTKPTTSTTKPPTATTKPTATTQPPVLQ